MLFRPPRASLPPTLTWAIILATLFITEYSVMLVLPWLMPKDTPRVIEAIVDSLILTSVLSPVLWLVLVRPLRGLIELRTQFLSDLFTQIEIDRRQVAYELHDGIGQSLTLLVSGLRSVQGNDPTSLQDERFLRFQRLAEDALLDVKRLALGLRPSVLDDLGLAPALERMVEDVRVHHPIDIHLDLTAITGVHLPDRLSTAVFRIVQEALSNVVKHSQATEANVTIRISDDELITEINDNGQGIEPDRLQKLPPGHLGLAGIRERASLLNGIGIIESIKGQGTKIHVTIPFQEVNHD